MDAETSLGLRLSKIHTILDVIKVILQERKMRAPSSSSVEILWVVTLKLQGWQEDSEVMCVSNSLRLEPCKALLQVK